MTDIIQRVQIFPKQGSDEYGKATTEIEQLRAVLRECADGLNELLKERYACGLSFQMIRQQYNIEMEPVLKARNLLRG